MSIMKQTPEGAPRTILENDAEVGCLGTSSQEQHNVGMPDDLHDSALILELFQLVLLDDLALDLLDGNNRVLPAAPVHDSITSLGELSVVRDLIEWDLVVLDECSGFVGMELLPTTELLLLLEQRLLQLSFEVLWIGTSLLELHKGLPLLW